MPYLIVETPDRPRQVIELERDRLVVGRAASADVQVEDSTVSGEHVRLRRLEDGRWLAADMASSSGTWRGRQEVQRVLLEAGDALKIGRSRLVFQEHAPTADVDEPLVGGSLALRQVEMPGAVPPAALTPSLEPERPGAPREPAPEPQVVHVVDGRALGRVLLLVAAGVLVLFGVETFLGREAGARARDAEARRELRAVLERMDVSFDTFQQEVAEYLVEHPRAPDRAALERYLESARKVESERVRLENSVNDFFLGRHDLPESEVRGRLLALKRAFPDDEALALRVSLALADLDRKRDQEVASLLDETIREANARLEARDPAGALRRLGAFRTAYLVTAPEETRRLVELEDRAIAAAKQMEEETLAAASAEPDPLRRRRLLADAWHGLAGTPQGVRIADALRFAGPTGRPGAGTGAVPSPTVPEPSVAEELLARAAEVERLAATRHWAQAREELGRLIAEARPGVLKDEWQARAREMDLFLGLIGTLGQATRSGTPPRVRLSTGTAEVKEADPEGVLLSRAETDARLAWADVPSQDLLPLLTPAKPSAEERLGVALLAASLSDREGFTQVLIPLFEKGEAVAEASELVARHLYGLARPPEGGYRVHRGEILDRAGYEKRLRAERAVALRAQAGEAFEKVAKDPAFKKLEKLKELRGELDRRRRHALLAIFNEKHYPYPYDRASLQYRTVQKEIDARVASVREVWDDPLKVKIPRKGALEKAFETWEASVTELKSLEEDVAALEEQMAPFAAYANGETFTIREVFLNDAERRLLAYNRWVVETYNPRQRAEATEPEARQTQVTNDYRVMMGFSAAVAPGPAPYEAIDETTVAKILDEGRIQSVVPLRAVRIDDRLVLSSRRHSLDMQKRGFFSHFAPPNPATGEPQTSPFDRMRAAGYTGGGASENIAAGAGSPEIAHDRWCHSSGHHRNILSPWTDQGVGLAGNLWTQNFGSGGGRPPVIEPEGDAPAGEDPSKRDRRGR